MYVYIFTWNGFVQTKFLNLKNLHSQIDKLLKYTQEVTNSRRIVQSLDWMKKFVVNTKEVRRD